MYDSWKLSNRLHLGYHLFYLSFQMQLRFLLPVLPLLNIPAAAALAWLWQRRSKSKVRALQFIAAAALVVLSFALACLFLAVSGLNYPGGEALDLLHELPQTTGEITSSQACCHRELGDVIHFCI